jgi:hypothetical protein
MRRVIRKQIRRQEPGINIAADVDAVVAVNSGTPGQTTTTRSKSTRQVVQGPPADPKPAEDDRKPRSEGR